jgi:UDP-N-acetylglucosamine 2-epimerase
MINGDGILMHQIALFIGTRPEAIKMLPVWKALQDLPRTFRTRLVLSGQHPDMVADFLDLFDAKPEVDLGVMRAGQSLADLTARITERAGAWLATERPDAVLVHGDTTTALCAALAAFYARIPVGHVEAGLRTHNLDAPFPEEFNRQAIDRLCTWAYAPTEGSAEHLLNEGLLAEQVHITGNTVVDAVYHVREWLANERNAVTFAARLNDKCPDLWPQNRPSSATNMNCGSSNRRKLFLVTCHRRENHAQLHKICAALHLIAKAFPDHQFLLPVHPNPQVRPVIERALANHPQFVLTDPLDYPTTIWALSNSKCVITDSGGLQEESTACETPCVILRESTERPEILSSGWGYLVGTDPARILKDTQHAAAASAEGNHSRPFGDGRAAERIAHQLASAFTLVSSESRLSRVSRPRHQPVKRSAHTVSLS